MKHVDGKHSGNIILYALSTCPWCKKVKTFLNEHGVAYDYVDVDLLQGKEKDDVIQTVTKWNPNCSFPTMVINNSKCIIGFDENEIKESLKL